MALAFRALSKLLCRCFIASLKNLLIKVKAGYTQGWAVVQRTEPSLSWLEGLLRALLPPPPGSRTGKAWALPPRTQMPIAWVGLEGPLLWSVLSG